MSTDQIMNLHYRGLSAREIAVRVGKTRNAVIGYVWRHKRRKSPPTKNKFHHDPETIAKAISESDGSVRLAARALGVSPKSLWVRGYKSRTYKRNASEDPATREVVSAINASGMPDYIVAEGAGIGITTIQGWRRGNKGHKFLLECVAEYLEKNTPGY